MMSFPLVSTYDGHVIISQLSFASFWGQSEESEAQYDHIFCLRTPVFSTSVKFRAVRLRCRTTILVQAAITTHSTFIAAAPSSGCSSYGGSLALPDLTPKRCEVRSCSCTYCTVLYCTYCTPLSLANNLEHFFTPIHIGVKKRSKLFASWVALSSGHRDGGSAKWSRKGTCFGGKFAPRKRKRHIQYEMKLTVHTIQ